MPSVLVIEDDNNMRVFICKVLESAGFTVRDAADGLEGMTSFRDDPSDLLITDIFLPGESGISVITKLRRDYPDLKILAISAAGEGQYGLRGVVHLGADTFLQKPFKQEELLKTVNGLVDEIEKAEDSDE